jgi:hypothetical protein
MVNEKGAQRYDNVLPTIIRNKNMEQNMPDGVDEMLEQGWKFM